MINFFVTLMHSINYFNCAFFNASVQHVQVVCCRLQTTTDLIYKIQPLSNLPSNNFICLSSENF